MKYLFFVLVLLHAVIHTVGFCKAFSFASFDQFANSISRVNGSLWLFTFILLFLLGILYLMNLDTWMVVSVLAIALSQYLIFTTWSDAKWGTIPNILIIFFTSIHLFQWNFHKKYDSDVKEMLMEHSIKGDDILRESDIQHLPELIQKYIRYSGGMDNPKVKNFHVLFSGGIRKNENSEWMEHNTEQYSSILSGTRLFFMNAKMKKLPVAGYHRFKGGHAKMDIKLLSLFRVQYAEGPKMDTSETVTFLNDLCLMAPAALIEPMITWGNQEDNKVHVFLSLHDINVSAWLYFNDQGQLIDFVSDDRYAFDEPNKMNRVKWSTPIFKYGDQNGYRLCVEAAAVYHYSTAPMTYATFQIKSIDYNVKMKNEK